VNRAAVTVLSERPITQVGVPRYELVEWGESYSIVAGITGRDGSGDFGLTGGDAADVVIARWRRLGNELAAGFCGIVVSRQVHGSAVGVHEGRVEGLLVKDGLDGHVSATSGVLLAVTVADCVPVYLAHPDSGAVGLVHAGWKGVAAGIMEVGIERLCQVAGAAPSDIVIHCGVSICGSCYEVGPEVYKRVTGVSMAGPTRLDLRENLMDRAVALGVGRATSSSWCTAHDGGQFYSHRASAGAAGRMVAYIGRPNT
jgi:YfiH family protein